MPPWFQLPELLVVTAKQRGEEAAAETEAAAKLREAEEATAAEEATEPAERPDKEMQEAAAKAVRLRRIENEARLTAKLQREGLRSKPGRKAADKEQRPPERHGLSEE